MQLIAILLLLFFVVSAPGVSAQTRIVSAQPPRGSTRIVSVQPPRGSTRIVSTQTIGQKQRRFSRLVAHLILQAETLGYEVTLGEAWRSPEMAIAQVLWNEEHGIGIANSLHTKRLAIDLNLFQDGMYLTKTEEYRLLGEWWEKQCTECRWGGRFKNLSDGNHFSIEHQGAK